MRHELPIPPHFDPARVGAVWRVPYRERASEAAAWAQEHAIEAADGDAPRVCLLAVDAQNTFCVPEFELFVRGRSGLGAVEDNIRLCEFIYRNLGRLTRIVATMDTHHAMQIFHTLFLVDQKGQHPEPFSLVSATEIEAGRWRFNPRLARALRIDEAYANAHLRHYTRALEKRGQYELTIWPFHSMLGGIGHALVSAVEETFFFHAIARNSATQFEVKGDNPLTEHYSVLGPEVCTGPDGEAIAVRNEGLVDALFSYDAVIIAGQAKSHCVAWSVDDLLREAQKSETRLVEKIYLLEDCTSAVVVPGAVDYSEQADAAFRRFASAGMHVVQSTDPIDTWPGFPTKV
ncbi:MAG: isochorismatase [Candidatus Latescibacterota bacterium]|nr:MAG: isochorismatase [Candidatus Latescibacterota bacterium]